MVATTNFNLQLTPLNDRQWKVDMDDNLHVIDAVLALHVAANNIRGVWKVALAVIVGDRYVDDTDDTLWEVLVAHTTHSTNTFSVDRANNPTFWQSVTGVGPADFESSDITLTADAEHTTAHGLVRVPRLIQAIIRCTVADEGYAIDDEVILGNSMDADVGATVFFNKTNIGVAVGSAINVISITSINAVAITLASWKLVLRGWT